jgi:hypothetical protein
VPYDVASADAVAPLRGTDVLIATAGGMGLRQQPALVDAAAAAGVKLFVPVEWGDVTDGRPEPVFKGKAAIIAKARELGLSTTAFCNGP